MSLLDTFRHRSPHEELMDDPAVPPEEYARALEDIRWVNRHLAGTRVIRDAVRDILNRHQRTEARILDLGTGSADIPRALATWGRRHGHRLQITAVDLHPVSVAEARALTADFPEIQIEQGDALHLSYADQSFDLVVSSMFMHHLSDAEAVRLLQEMARMSRLGLVVNDLERHPLAWLGIRVVGQILGKGRVFRHDAPLSVLRGFTLAELHTLRNQSGLDLTIRRRWPWRVVLSWECPI